MNIDDLIKKAEELYRSNKSWHFHYLAPKCAFNQSEMHKVILEDEETGAKWEVGLSEKPLDKLEKLENFFYKRV